MVKIAGVPPRGVVLGFKGTLDFSTWKGQPYVRRWPRARTTPATPQEMAQWADFREITQGYKTMDASVVNLLTPLVRGSQLTTKDFAVQLFYGKGIEEDVDLTEV